MIEIKDLGKDKLVRVPVLINSPDLHGEISEPCSCERLYFRVPSSSHQENLRRLGSSCLC